MRFTRLQGIFKSSSEYKRRGPDWQERLRRWLNGHVGYMKTCTLAGPSKCAELYSIFPQIRRIVLWNVRRGKSGGWTLFISFQGLRLVQLVCKIGIVVRNEGLFIIIEGIIISYDFPEAIDIYLAIGWVIACLITILAHRCCHFYTPSAPLEVIDRRLTINRWCCTRRTGDCECERGLWQVSRPVLKAKTGCTWPSPSDGKELFWSGSVQFWKLLKLCHPLHCYIIFPPFRLQWLYAGAS